MKKGPIIAGAAVLVIAVVVVVVVMTRDPKPKEIPKVVVPTGPDPAHVAKVGELVRQVEALEAKGQFKEALSALAKLAALEPSEPRLAVLKPRLEEKLRRLEAWRGAFQLAESARVDALRRNMPADWQKVIDASAEAEKHAPAEEQQRLTRELAAAARQGHGWSSAREEEKKGNLAAALDLATQAIAAAPAPAELTAYKASLEKKKRKQEFDRAAAAARGEPVPARAYELWQKLRPLAEDAKDVAEADAKIDALKPWVDPAERDRRYDLAMKAGETALAAGELDAAEKSFKEAQALKVTDPKPAQGIAQIATARRQKTYDAALAAARAAEEKREWADAIEAYDRAIRIKPGEAAPKTRRKELEETWRPPKITLVLSETGIKMDFVLIKRGAFTMGDSQGDGDEKPHEETIARDFWMQTTELTQAQWAIVMNTKPWSSNSVPQMPVEGVTFEETQKYFEKLNALTAPQLKGRKASLPTEAEWEYACRAGTTTRWNFGNDESQFDLHGWYTRNASKAPQTVGQKRANAWGLFDMHGNVAEWCADGYASTSDKAAAEAAPMRCIRGGSWNDRAVTCRSAKREKDLPTKSSMFLGFRAVLR